MQSFLSIKFTGRVLPLILFSIMSSASANAALLLDTGVGSSTTNRAPGPEGGIAVGVSFSTTTTVTGFAMDFFMPGGGNVKYMIWDSLGTTNLYLGTAQAVAASNVTSSFQSNAFNLVLNAGNTYYFGVIGDAAYTLTYTFTVTSQNGLSTITPNFNYGNFANPTLTVNDQGGAQGDLKIYGTQGSVEGVPEPASLGLIGAGLVLLAVQASKRKH